MRSTTTMAATTTTVRTPPTMRPRAVPRARVARAMTTMASSSPSRARVSSTTPRRVRASIARATDPSSTPSDDDDASSEDEGSAVNLSSSFAEELAKRRAAGEASSSSSSASSNPFERGAGSGTAPPRFSPDRSTRRAVDEGDQLARSRALQAEGARRRLVCASRSRFVSLSLSFFLSTTMIDLDSPRTGLEGFPARASELLKLGFSTFLGFGPFIAAISVVFCLTYLLFGSDFIHSGDEGYGSPAFVPAEVLLGEPTVDPMIPFDDPSVDRR